MADEIMTPVNETELIPEQNDTALAPSYGSNKPTMWNDDKLLVKAYKAAKYLSSSALVPTMYQNKPENCLIALDVANRTGYSPLTVMQQLYIVQGKPSWSGQMAIALINASNRFTPLDFVWCGEPGTPSHGCQAVAHRKEDGKLCTSPAVTLKLAQDEGWLNKNGSKWKTMPEQMMMYRAGAFFARTYCPDLLLGIPLADEIYDTTTDAVPKTKIAFTIGSED